MRWSPATALIASMLCAACGGGGGGTFDPKPPDPCADLGYGEVPAGLVGDWDYTLGGNPSSLTLYDNGTFVDHLGGGRYPGFWGLAADGTFTAKYSLSTECPPTGTLLTASDVTATDTEVTGTVVSSPIAGLAGKGWSIAR